MIPEGKKIRGIGIDIIEIERIRSITSKHEQRFLNRVYTETERAYCLTKSNPYPSLAVRFAAKEALSKALGCGIGEMVGWQDISIFTKESGAPEISLHQNVYKKMGIPDTDSFLVSLSHTHKMAQATVLWVE